MATPFTREELDRMRTTLWKRYGRRYGNTLLDIGFGLAIKEGEEAAPDPSRPFSVRFYVQAKRKRVPASDRLPKEVTLRVKREGKFESHTFPTDVFSLGAFKPTGSALITPLSPGSTDTAVGGVMVEWDINTPAGPLQQAALLTVGHACGNPALLGVLDSFVAVGPGAVIGRLAAKANGVPLDTAIVLINRSAVLSAAGNPLVTSGPMPLALLDMATGQRGASLRPDGVFPFRVLGPSENLHLPILGPQANVVHVRADAPGAFMPSTSGSAWVVENPAGVPQAALIQLGGYAPDYQIGVGQALDLTSLDWVSAQVLTNPAVAGPIRFIGAF